MTVPAEDFRRPLKRAERQHYPAVLTQMRYRFHCTAKAVEVGDGFRTEEAKTIEALGKKIGKKIDRTVGIERRRGNKEQPLGPDKGLESLVDRSISAGHG